MMGISSAEPTDTREWSSTAGTKVTGSALSVAGGQVEMKLTDGRQLKVPIDKLSEADQSFLNEHFGSDAVVSRAGTAGTKGSTAEALPEGLPHPVGEVVGPIEAGGGSTYYLYIPHTLKKDRPAPLLHFNGSGGGSAGSVQKHVDGAELNGWIVAANVESRNGGGWDSNTEHAKNCVKHIIKTLPVDPKRVYFTGGSGGGAMSFRNSALITSSGAMPHIGYIPEGINIKSGDYFVISGATDYNRYVSALAVGKIGKGAIHRFFVGGHSEGPGWLCTEGMAWLNGRFLAGTKRDPKLIAEKQDYEASMLAWIKELEASEPHRAYYWCDFLKENYSISGTNAAAVNEVHARLAAKPENVKYAEGIEDISKFSAKNFTDQGGGAKFHHTTTGIESAAGRLATKYAGVPMIEEIAKELGKQTVGQ